MSTSTTILLRDITGLDPKTAKVWVAGWINGGSNGENEQNGNDGYFGPFQALQADGAFAGTHAAPPANVPFYEVSSTPTVTLSVATNGNDRLVFVVSPDQPTALTVANVAPQPQPPTPPPPAQYMPIQYTQYPYANAPGVAAPGPFDIFEFGQDAQYDVAAVSGFGLNLSFSVTNDGALAALEQYGPRGTVTRKDIGKAFSAFVAAEAVKLPAAQAFAELLYDGAIGIDGAPAPPSVDGQYFGICDPNDMLAALTGNYGNTTDDPLASYWDSALTAFFKVGNYLSINLSANPAAPDIYSGQSSMQTNKQTTVASAAYTLTNGPNTHTFYMPLAAEASPPGLTGAQYVFQQAFGDLTPAGAADDAGLLQDCIWEALCRGVAQSGVSTTKITKGESTTAWNDADNWYPAASVSHIYAKFLHCSDIDGNDCRTSGKPPIFHGGAAYGFSMDENPVGPYSGPNVPSKTTSNVPAGSTVTVYVGPWDSVAPPNRR